MRCSYCVYEHNHKYEFNFNEFCKTFFKLKKAYPGKQLIFNILGGEPTLSLDVFYKLANFLIHHNCAIKLMTNGLLWDDELVKFIVKNDIFLDVSFDGHIGSLRATPEQNRIISENILKYKELVKRSRFSIFYVVTKDNIDYFYQNFDYIYRTLGIHRIRIIEDDYALLYGDKERHEFFEKVLEIRTYAYNIFVSHRDETYYTYFRELQPHNYVGNHKILNQSLKDGLIIRDNCNRDCYITNGTIEPCLTKSLHKEYSIDKTDHQICMECKANEMSVYNRLREEVNKI